MSPEQFAARIRGLSQSLKNDPFSEEKREIGDQFREEQAANFRRQEDELGQKWKPRVGDPPWPPLIKTGAMFRAATTLGARGNISRVDHRSVTFGVSDDIDYAKDHHNGKAEKRLPRRRFLYWRPDRMTGVREVFLKGLRRLAMQVLKG